MKPKRQPTTPKQRARAKWRKAFLTKIGKDSACYQEAMRREGEPVTIVFSDETGDPLYAVQLEDGFWMATFDLEAYAEKFVSDIGWPLIVDDD